jgi:hypothetical protein
MTSKKTQRSRSLTRLKDDGIRDDNFCRAREKANGKDGGVGTTSVLFCFPWLVNGVIPNPVA